MRDSGLQTDGDLAGCWLDDAPPGYGAGSGLMRTGQNEHGTPIGVFICGTCGGEYAWCPRPAQPDPERWRHCTLRCCDSYDPNRDVDIVFMTDAEIAALPVVALDMLRARKAGLRRRPVAGDGSTQDGGDRG